MKRKRKTLGFSIGMIAVVFGALGMTAPKGDMPRHEDMVTAAQKFLEALGPGLGARAVFPFESEERFRWHFVPNEMFKRSGISIKEMTYDQRKAAHAKLEKIKKAGIEKIYFAWAGSTEPGKEHYYRVQGPNLLIEYDNTQNNANHIHAVLRDPDDDYGFSSLG